MGLIDRVGCFRGDILESGVGSTKNGFPQFTVRLAATERFVDDRAEMEAFGMTEPDWQPWTDYQQEIVGYLVLFGSDKKNPDGPPKATFQLENVQKATGWDGASFQVLGSTSYAGKKVTFWVDENEYEGNVSLRVGTIDVPDAPPIRGLKALDGEGLKDLDTKFAGMLAGKKTAATPTKAPAKAPAAGPKTPPTGKPATAAPKAAAKTEAKPEAPKTEAKAPPKGPPKKAAAAAPKEEAPFEATGMTMEAAWEHVMANKPATASDDAVAEKWLDAAGAVCPGKAEEAFTEQEWAKVAQHVLAALQAKAAA